MKIRILTTGQKSFMLESLKGQKSPKTEAEKSLLKELRADSKRPKL